MTPRFRCFRSMLNLHRGLCVTAILFTLSGTPAIAQHSPPIRLNSPVPQAHIDPRTVTLPVADGDDIRFTHLSQTQGLSQIRVTDIIQDNQGFMWFGTQYGLDRFDGYKFRVFTHDAMNSRSLGCVQIFALYKDRAGTLWIGCADSLESFDPATETFTHHYIGGHASKSVGETVTHISGDRNGMLWLSTPNGLYRFEPATGRAARFGHDPRNPYSLSSNEIKSSGEDRSGALWVSTAGGLDRLDPQTGRVTLHIPIIESRDLSFYEDRLGTFWITYASGNGLAILDRATQTVTRYSFATKAPRAAALTGVIAVMEDQEGVLWFGTLSDGLMKFDREHRMFVRYRNHPGDPESLAEDRVTTLFDDREGNVWVGLGATAPNVFGKSTPPFARLPYEASNSAGLGENLVNALFLDSRGVLWMGATGGLNRLDRETKHYTHYEIPGRGVSSDVLAIAEDRSGDLWLGTSGEGLHRFDPSTGRDVSYVHDPNDPTSISNDVVTHLLVDRRGVLWATTWDGLDRFDAASNRFRTYRHDPQIHSAWYVGVTEDAEGNLWFGSATAGLIRFDPAAEQFTVFRHDPTTVGSLSDNRVNSVIVTRSGNVWAGTQNGLNRLNQATGSFTTFYEKSGLPSNAISCILEDDKRNLWMSTNNGLSRFNPSKQSFKNYSVADGLPGADLTGWGTCFRNESGEMFFGGYAGATWFHPDQVLDDAFTPPIVLTNFEISGTRVPVGDSSPLEKAIGYTSHLALSPSQNNFTLEFSALSFRSPSTNRYRYMLQGLDSTWHEVPSDRRLASYTTLPAGDYVFRVQGATSRGPWSEPGTAVSISILPPWWKTWWFRSVLVATLVLSLFGAYYSRVRHIARRFEIRLEERAGERTRIARELHDSLLQGFQGLMFRLQAVRDLLPGRPTEAVQILETVLEKGDQVIAEGRDTVQDLRSSALVGSDLVRTLTGLGEELASNAAVGNAPTCRVLVEGRPRPLKPVVRDEVYIIAREAYRNAFRHSRSRGIEAELSYGERQFTLHIRDDGVGIDRQLLELGRREGHWGLPGMHERAKSFGGQLAIWSEIGAGTEVELTIPAGIAYIKENTRS